MSTRIDPGWRGHKRALVARNLDDRAFLSMLQGQLRETERDTSRPAVRFALRFLGSRADEIMLSGYEIERLYELARRVPPKAFLQEEGYEIPAKVLKGLLERIQLPERETGDTP